MPYVNVQLAGKLTLEQKQKIAEGVTDVLFEVANKPKDSVMIVIDEIDRDNLAKGGKLLSEQ